MASIPVGGGSRKQDQSTPWEMSVLGEGVSRGLGGRYGRKGEGPEWVSQRRCLKAQGRRGDS